MRIAITTVDYPTESAFEGVLEPVAVKQLVKDIRRTSDLLTLTFVQDPKAVPPRRLIVTDPLDTTITEVEYLPGDDFGFLQELVEEGAPVPVSQFQVRMPLLVDVALLCPGAAPKRRQRRIDFEVLDGRLRTSGHSETTPVYWKFVARIPKST